MNQLRRRDPPSWLSSDTSGVERRRAWYSDLRDSREQIRDRWNERDEMNAQPIRKAVYELGGGCCAWCGERLSDWHVEHYLPKDKFPRLSYCWQVMLPSCTTCNLRRKQSWCPPALVRDSLFDPALDTSTQVGDPYEPGVVLPPIEERLVDPAFDDPARHLRFEPALCQYLALSSIGRCTVTRIFGEKAQAERWERVGNFVRTIVESSATPDERQSMLAQLVSLIGSETCVREYAKHWRQLLRPGELGDDL